MNKKRYRLGQFWPGLLFSIGLLTVNGLAGSISLAAAYENLKGLPPPVTPSVLPVEKSSATANLSADLSGVRLASEASETDDYILGPGDVILVNIWGQLSEITTSRLKIQALPDLTVTADGKLIVPILGEIKAAGRTFRDIKKDISQRFGLYYHDVSITVVLKSMPSFRIYVLGEVRNPGLHPGLPSPTFGNPDERRVLNFIAMAGGASGNPNLQNVQVIRTDPLTGKSQTISLNLVKLIQDSDLSQNIVIQKGDTIIVPQKITSVYVLGEVNRAGAFSYVTEAKLIDYITWAGGVRDTAAASNIGIIRGQGSEAKVITASLNDILKWGRSGPMSRIMPGDIIYVPKNFIANWNDILSILRLTQASLDTPRNLRNSYYELQKVLKAPLSPP